MYVAAHQRGWQEVETDDKHPMSGVVGRKVGPFVVRIFGGPRSRFGARSFRLHLENRQGVSRDALLGLCNGGAQPSHNWVEIVAAAFSTEFPGGQQSLDPLRNRVGREIWQAVADAIPAGGHLMVEYESAEWRETRDGLGRDFPPVVTPLGHLMFSIGCGVNFKDWYFSEGLHEGPRKLQGWKALDEQHFQRRAAEMAADVAAFLSASDVASAPILVRARRRAQDVLLRLHSSS